MTTNVLFLCPHAAAKSVMAAALLARKGEEHGLDLALDNAGTDPDPVVNPIVASHLSEHGYPAGAQPSVVTAQTLSWADIIVNIGCSRGDLQTETEIRDWQIPNFSDGPPAAFAALEEHVDRLVADLSSQS